MPTQKHVKVRILYYLYSTQPHISDMRKRTPYVIQRLYIYGIYIYLYI